MSKNLRDPYPPNRRSATWQCRTCSYKPNAGDTCVNCGRDWFGTDPVKNPPTAEDKPHRPGLRG